MRLSKSIAILRWVLAILFQLITVVLSLIVYPLAYVLRDHLRAMRQSNNKVIRIVAVPLWIFLDDECVELTGDDYGEYWYKLVNDINIDTMTKWELFVVAYKWGAIRNPAWNQHTMIQPNEGMETLVSYKGSTTSAYWWEFAELKWMTNGNPSDNQGECIAPPPYSVFGEAMVWYTAGDRLYWRYSFAGKKFGRFVEIQIGTTEGKQWINKRYTWRMKIKGTDAKRCEL